MAVLSLEAPPGAAAPSRREPDPRILTVLLMGLPVWWFLGLSELGVLFAGGVMAWNLRRVRPVRAPRGYGIWLLFLVWVAGGVFVLTAVTPGGSQGGSATRLLVFGYRFTWYLVLAVVVLYLGNVSRQALPSIKVARLLAWTFGVVAAGGILGLTVPGLSFRSPAEMALGPIGKQPFVSILVHPVAATIQSGPLGFPEPRPSAPFAYANTWGAAFALTLPFFLYVCFGPRAGWRRWAGVPVLLIALIPFVYSLNRALWGAVALELVFGAVHLARRGRYQSAIGLAGLVAALALAVVLTPLGDLITQRIGHPHSNERRGNLAQQTASIALHTSPVVGFGSTRPGSTSFSSIAGGARPGCPACGVPPLGTQGQFWFVLFAHGLVGLVLFLMFFVSRFLAHRQDDDPFGVLLRVTLLAYALMLPFYDMLGMPSFVVMIAIGLAWREQRAAPPPTTADPGTSVRARPDRELREYTRAARRGIPVILFCAISGLVVGGVVNLERTPTYRTSISVLAPATPVYLTSIPDDVSGATTSLDTTAQVLTGLANEVIAEQGGDARASVTATPNTRVLSLRIESGTPTGIEAIAAEAGARFVERTRESSDSLADPLISELGRQRAMLSSEIGSIRQSEARLPAKDPRRSALSVLRQNLGKELVEADASLTALTSRSGLDAEIVDSPRPPIRERGQLEVDLTSGLMVGLLLGLLIAWARRDEESGVTVSAGEPSTGQELVFSAPRRPLRGPDRP